MDLEKIGKFIAELRNEKNLTQEQLGQMVNASSQTVSKWERGISMPNNSIMIKLCEILDIEIKELLLGERINESNNKILKKVDRKSEQAIIDGFNYCEKKAKNKVLKISFIIFVILISIIVILLFLYCVNNYNQIKIYNIYSDSENLDLSGRIIFNPDKKIISINKMRYNDKYTGTIKELKVKAVNLKIVSEDKILYDTGNLDYSDEQEVYRINEFLDKIEIDMSSSIDDYILQERDLENLSVEINYVDINNEFKDIAFKLSSEKEFSNNKILYD